MSLSRSVRDYSRPFPLGAACGVALLPIVLLFCLAMEADLLWSEGVMLVVAIFSLVLAFFIWTPRRVPEQLAARRTPRNVEELENKQDALSGTGRYAVGPLRSWLYGFVWAVCLTAFVWTVLFEAIKR